MEKFYKQNYLKEMSMHAELLIYDWSEGGEVEIVVEDIERIDFDKYDAQDSRMKDWTGYSEEDWGVLRNKYADQKNQVMAYFNVPMFHVPELTIEAEEAKIYHDLVNNAPGEVYDVGFNSQMGDDGVLFKLKGQRRDTLPIRERVLE